MKKFKTYSILFALVIFIPFLIPANLKAQTYTLDLVADLQTPIPGGFGVFESLSGPVSLDTVESEAFIGSANPAEGIYTNVGGSVVLVADENTAIPGGTAPGNADCNGDGVVNTGDIGCVINIFLAGG